MDQELKECKQIIRGFMREHYSDERLAMLLAHAQSGRLAYHSCCCFIGVVTADHALRSQVSSAANANYLGLARANHLGLARTTLRGAFEAEAAFLNLSVNFYGGDPQRIRRLIPIIKAEIRRRDRERQAIAATADAYALTL